MKEGMCSCCTLKITDDDDEKEEGEKRKGRGSEAIDFIESNAFVLAACVVMLL